MSEPRTMVIVGAGLAGAKAAEALRAEGFDGRVVVVGDEPHPPYLRPPLSKEYLRGEASSDETLVRPAGWYEERAIELLRASAGTVDAARREVELADGRRLAFDRLLLATGAAPRILDVPGAGLPGVHHLRTIEDADAIRTAASSARKVVVVGGGWIGAEVSASLRQLGLPVTLVTPGAAPLERALGADVAAIYRDVHAAHGVVLAANRRVTAFAGAARVERVETDDGSSIEADLVVVGAGARARTRLATEAGLDVDDGIVVDERLETSVPGIFAAGDVAAAWHPLFATRLRLEHWDNARRQGAAAARNMLGAAEPYARIPYLYSDQFDLSMEHAGFAPAWDRVLFRGDPAGRAFVAFWLSGGRVLAGMNVNVPKVSPAIAAMVASQRAVDPERLADPAIPLDDLDGLAPRGEPMP